MRQLDDLHPTFRPLVRDLLVHVSHLCALAGCSWYLASAWRSPEKQWDLYRKGRELKGVDWVPVQGKSRVTNAQPHQTPHCVMLEGKPASCAVDIALVSVPPPDAPGGRRWLSNSDPRWGIIGAAIGVLGATETLTWGGMFKSLRDYPHVELTNYRDLITDVGKGAL